MGKIVVKEVKIEKNNIYIDYDVSEDLKEFFNLENKFHADYFEDVSKVPHSVAVIPFVANVLPIIWLTDSTLYLDELDEKYFKTIVKTRKAFNEMYKLDIFKGKVVVKNKVKNVVKKKENCSVFYSGGVDSTYSFVDILKQKKKPLLITIWGTDVWDHNEEGWQSLKENSIKCGQEYKLKNLFIKTNFRKFIYEHVLTEKLLKGKINDSWWRGIQHGIGLLGHVAPLAFKYNITTHYIPATLNNKNDGSTCGSYPTIDESVKFINCDIIHSGYDKTRLEKVEDIINYFKSISKKFDLRVCYMDKGSKLNCCKCEKCYLTIMEILVNKENPNDWGFNITDSEIGQIKDFLLKNASDSSINIEIWDAIIKKAHENKEYIMSNNNYKWILKYKNQKGFMSKLFRRKR